MHGDWLHIIGNMLFLWIFGNNVEDAMGHVRFLVFYLLAGFAATALQTYVTLDFGTDFEATIPNLGASGAVSGVLGAYLILLPRASVLILIFIGLIFIREVPAAFFLGFWFLFQLWFGGFSLVEPQSGAGVAFFAHIGGFAFGLLAVFVFRKRTPLQPAY
jgi:membrane associated rhomboid family serine protease